MKNVRSVVASYNGTLGGYIFTSAAVSFGPGLPTRSARIGRPSAERPIVFQRASGAAGTALEAPATGGASAPSGGAPEAPGAGAAAAAAARKTAARDSMS